MRRSLHFNSLFSYNKQFQNHKQLQIYNSNEDFPDNGIISKMYNRPQHISYDISKKSEQNIFKIYEMVKKLDKESEKNKLYNSQERELESLKSNLLPFI